MGWTDPNDASGDAVTGEVAPAALWNTFVKGNMLAMLAVPAMRVAGTAGGFGESWHISLPVVAGASIFSSIALTTNTIYASPLVCPPGTLDRMSFEVQATGGANNARHGIYAPVSTNDPYPGALLVDSGDISVSATGFKTTTINVTLEMGKLYWMVLQTSAGAPTITQFSGGGFIAPFGDLGRTTWSTGTDYQIIAFSLVRSYAALPGTYPAFSGATRINPHAFGLRYSA